jgi:ABC-2 type transport system permease protein
MGKFFSLLKLQINSQLGLSAARYAMKHDKKSLWKGIGTGLAIVLSLAVFAYMYIFLILQFYEAGKALQTPQLIITLGAVGSGLLVLFFGIFYIIGALFLAKDSEFLASLPIRQGNVFLSKFTLVLLGEYPLILFMMLPPVIIYGVNAQKGVLYYLAAVLCMLLLPLVPLLLASLFSLLLMQLVSRTRRRDLILLIGAVILVLVVSIGPSMLLSSMDENDPNLMLKILQKSDGMIELSGRVFPPAIWITRVLSLDLPDSLLNLGYLVALSAAAFCLVYLLASFVYQKGATAQMESEKRSRKTKLNYKVSSPLLVMYRTEWRNILRTPIFALNSLILVFVGPIIMCLPLLGGSMAQDPDIQALYTLIEQGKNGPVLPLILAGILCLINLMNPAVSSTFSREGKNIWILKNIPVDIRIQAMGKLLLGYTISMAGAIATAIVMAFAFKLDVPVTLLSIGLCALALIPVTISGIFIDLMRPKLNWNNPQEAIKQNANVILAMLVGGIILVILGGMAYFLSTLIANNLLLFSVFALILAVLSGLSLGAFIKTAPKAFRRIEG